MDILFIDWLSINRELLVESIQNNGEKQATFFY